VRPLAWIALIGLGACGPAHTGSKVPPKVEPPEPTATYDQNGDEIDAPAGESDRPAQLLDPPAGGDGEVVSDGDGNCWYVVPAECEPNAPCDPPAPTPVRCPAPKR
jgi:hypothetical protein